MTLLIPLFAILVTIFLFAGRRVSSDGLTSPLTVLSFSLLFYYVTVPIELWLRDETVVGFTGFEMSPDIGERILWMSLIGFVSLAAGYFLIASTRNSPNDLSPSHRSEARRAKQVALGVSVVGALLLATVFRENVAASTDYLSNVSQTSAEAGNIAYFIANRWTYLSYGIFSFLSIASANRRWLAVVTVIPLIAWSVYSNDKDPLLITALAFGGFLHNRHSQKPTHPGWSVLAVCASGIAAFGVGALVYGENRAERSIGANGIQSLLNAGVFTNIDPAGPSAVLSVELSTPGAQGSLLPSLLAPFTWIPSLLRPFDIPPDLAVTFAQKHWAGWKPGYGYGYSPIAEGWQGMGLLGVILVLFAIGVFFALMRNWLLNGANGSKSSSWLRLGGYNVIVAYLAFVSMRGTLTSLFSTAFIALLLLILLVLITRLIDRPGKVGN